MREGRHLAPLCRRFHEGLAAVQDAGAISRYTPRAVGRLGARDALQIDQSPEGHCFHDAAAEDGVVANLGEAELELATIGRLHAPPDELGEPVAAPTGRPRRAPIRAVKERVAYLRELKIEQPVTAGVEAAVVGARIAVDEGREARLECEGRHDRVVKLIASMRAVVIGWDEKAASFKISASERRAAARAFRLAGSSSV